MLKEFVDKIQSLAFTQIDLDGQKKNPGSERRPGFRQGLDEALAVRQ